MSTTNSSDEANVENSPCPSPVTVEELQNDPNVEATDEEVTQQEAEPCESMPDVEIEACDEEGETKEEQEDGEEYEERNEEFICQICDNTFNMPKVLTCLHVFCQECLEKQVEPDTPEESDKIQASIIVCTICHQETRVGPKGVAELQPDNVMVNLQDMEAIKKMKIICTSCKAKEKAVARCSDCANFLCPNCVTAHQYMRCFENHKVVSFDDMGSGFKLHKPLFCSNHPTESLKYFCKTCQIPVCTECMVTTHKHPEHECEKIVALDDTIKSQVSSLVKEAKGKVDYCEQASSSLENCLADLQMQRDDARGLIEETFQTYKAILDERKGMMLTELEDIHNKHRDSILHVFDNVGKTIDKIEDSCMFTERVMDHGNCTEVLLVKRLIFTQLMSLIHNTPKADVNVKIEFHTNADKFKESVNCNFGTFKKSDMLPRENVPATLHSSFEGEGINLPDTLLSPQATLLGHPQDLTRSLAGASLANLTPPTLPNMSAPATLSGVSPQTINSIASSIQSLTGVVPSLQATPVERSSSRNSTCSPAMSDSGISVDAASNGSGSNQHAFSFAALQRIGTINANNHGQVTMNGQVIPGLNVSNVSGFPPFPVHRSGTPTTPDPGLASLLGGMNPSQPITTPRPSTPLGDISNVLNQHTPPTIATQFPGQLGGIPMRSPTGGYNIHSHPQFPPRSTGKVNPMQIRCKFGQLGPGKGQFNSPHGFCLGMDEDIVVADTNNHRIQVFEKTGEFKYQFGIPGREEGQLWYPRKVAVIRVSGKYVVCDRGNERSRMQIFTKNGHFIKKIAIRYIDIVAGLAISQAGHIVAVDSVSPTVFVIAESGDLVKWFDCSDYMREPSDIAVSGKEYFVCDFKGHCVVVFNEEGQFLRRIGCENITNFPNGIDISDAGDVLVGDSHGNRFHVGVFQRDGSLIGEFECPYVKVSRCCGLKITSEGYVVTLAKNNHHVLVLNTLYIT